MTTVIIDAGTLTANRTERIVTGLLLPYGEECRSNLGKFSFARGTVAIPADIAGMSLNVEHAREDVIGAPVTVTDTDAGVVVSFRVASTAAGDAALDDIAAGRRKHLSAEVAGVKIKDGKGIAGRLFAAALVAEPAFPSATLLAAAADTDADSSYHTEETYTDENGVTWTRVYDTVSTSSTEQSGDTTTTTTATTSVVEETEEPATPAEDEEEPEVATVPNTLTATKAHETAAAVVHDLGNIYASIASLRSATPTVEAQTLLAALTDIKISGAGALPAAGVLQNNWVGQIWQGKSYERQFINLLKLGTDINAAGKKGFKINRGTAAAPKTILGGDWAGNKVEVPTGAGFTETAQSSLRRFAFAADIAREFVDLPGGAEIVEAFIRLIVEDYAVWSDEKALADIVTTAGALVAPKVYPTQYSGAIGQLIQGVLAVKAARDVPSFAIVNATAYEQLVYTPKDLVPEFVSFDFNTDGGGTADGKVTVVSAPDSFFTGAKANTPATIVGARNAIEFDEVSSTPIQIDALEIAKGGIDRALHGYLQTFVVRPAGIVHIAEAAA